MQRLNQTTTANIPQSVPADIVRRWIVRHAVAAVLYIASALKTVQLLLQPSDGHTAWTLVIAGELLLAAWIASGKGWRACWVVAMSVFLGFSAYNIHAMATGSDACDCFGHLSVHPGVALALDIVVLSALVAIRPALKRHGPGQVDPMLWGKGTATMVVLTTTVATATLYFVRPQHHAVGRPLPERNQGVVLQPNTWRGHTLPIIDHIDVGSRLTEGKWVVMFYRDDCSKCREALPIAIAKALSWKQMGVQLAVIAVSSDAPTNMAVQDRVLVGQLSTANRWGMPTPTFVGLDKGQVTLVSQELPSYAELQW